MIKELNSHCINELEIIQNNFSELKTHKIELKSDFKNNPFTRLFAYCLNDKIVGILEFNNLIDNYDIVYINVLQEYRRQKIATKLLQYLINDAKKNNVRNITLEVNINNKNAIDLYTKLEFKKVAIRQGYYNGTDGVLMERKLI